MATRKQQRAQELTRRQQLNVMRHRQQAAERRRRATRNGVLGTVVLAVVGGLVWLGVTASGNNGTPTIAGVRTYDVPSRQHVTGTVSYPQTPPVGGNHAPQWLNCGIYTSPVPTENAVHDMEHGAVWITYQPTLSSEQVQTLTALVRGKAFVDLSPFTGLPRPVVASAWGKQLTLDRADDPRLAKFIATYAQGPQSPEPGAPCTGGIGTPTS